MVLGKLDQLGGTSLEVINQIHALQQKGIYIRTLDSLVNSRELGAVGSTLTGLLASLAEIDRSPTRKRTLVNAESRRVNGKSVGGRPKTSEAKESLVVRLREEGYSYRSIREQTGLALSTIRRIIIDKEALVA